jgi:hypothetical protein
MNDQCMNTSAITNQIHATTTSAAGTGFLRRIMAGALLATALSTTAVGFAATSHAQYGAPTTANCKTDLWGFLGSQRRTLCDGPISADGSWSRERTIWQPAGFSTSSCYGGGYGGGRWSSGHYCSGGYFTPERQISNETYPVRPDTVLPDEPGHLG